MKVNISTVYYLQLVLMKNGYVSIFNVKVKPNGEHKLAFDYFGVGRFRDWKNSFSSYIWFYKDDKVYIVLN